MNLSAYTSVAFGLFVKIHNTSRQLLFSDWPQSVVINNQTYLGLGRLLNITASNSELGPTDSEVTISVSGIPNTALTDIINYPMKGNSIQILRAAFDPVSLTLLNIAGNPSGRFSGYVTNYALNEEYDIVARQSMTTITIMANNVMTVLANTTSGRRCNRADQRKFYPNDASMDNIANLKSSYFDFGRET